MQFHDSELVFDIDYQVRLIWATAILRIPGGKGLSPQIFVVITPEIPKVLEEELVKTKNLP